MDKIICNTVFSRVSGNAGNYRIPAIVKTKRGTLIACSDERYFTGADNPNRIDKVIRRSVDNGVSWEEQIVAVKEYGDSKEFASAAIDPTLLYDEDSDTIFMLYLHTPAGVGILTSAKGKGYDKAGRKIVRVGKRKAYIDENNSIIMSDGKDSGYKFDGKSCVYKDGKLVGNIFTGDCEVREWNSCFLYISKSTDDGLSWSEPECLNMQVKENYMSFIGACPGVGIKIKNGKYAGRLVFPIYYNTIRVGLSLSSCVIYSDDGGKSWKRGKSPNDGRFDFIFRLSSRFVADWDMITESQVIELPNGDLRMFMRNHNPKRLVAMAESTDGGESWKHYRHNKNLIQPICQVSAINVEYNGKPATLVCNSADKKKRINGTVRLSYDYGETFAASALVKEGEFVYSSMVQADDGDIVLLYEGSTQHETIEAVKFPISAIEEGGVISHG